MRELGQVGTVEERGEGGWGRGMGRNQEAKGEGGERLKGMAEPECQKRTDCRDWYLG